MFWEEGGVKIAVTVHNSSSFGPQQPAVDGTRKTTLCIRHQQYCRQQNHRKIY